MSAVSETRSAARPAIRADVILLVLVGLLALIFAEQLLSGWLALGDRSQTQLRIAEAQNLMTRERTEYRRLQRELDTLQTQLSNASANRPA